MHSLYRSALVRDSVELKLVGEVHVHLAHHEMMDWPCPECGAACKLYEVAVSTETYSCCGSKVIMSPLGKVEMSP